jgi:hypothetical protein
MAKASKTVYSSSNKVELKELLVQAAQSKAQVVKAEKPVAQVCNAQVHAAIVTIGRTEEAANKADGKRYPAFKEMLSLALPLMADAGQWAAIVIDLHQALKARNLPAVGVQLVGVVNNARHIAYGKAKTRDMYCDEPAHGLDVVYEALDAATSVKTLKSALAAMKIEKHASQGKPRGETEQKGKKVAPVAPVKADDVQIPATRIEALNAACRILAFVSSTFLSAGTDADLIGEVDEVIQALKAKAA